MSLCMGALAHCGLINFSCRLRRILASDVLRGDTVGALPAAAEPAIMSPRQHKVLCLNGNFDLELDVIVLRGSDLKGEKEGRS